MQTFFGPDFFSANRSKLRAQIIASTAIILTGNGNMQRAADEPAKFVQDSNFWYLTGLNSADLTLVMTASDTFLIVPERSTERAAFDGSHDAAAYAARSGITDIVDLRTGWSRVRALLHSPATVATCMPLPPYLQRHGLHTLPYRRRLITKLQRLQSGIQFTDIRPTLGQMRAVKQPEELKALQAAIIITGQTLQDIATTTLATAEYEYQLEAAITYGFRSRGAEDHAFAPIVGAGQHGTTLHYLENSGSLTADDLIVLDVGASVEHYAADVTRTVSKQPITGRRAEVFNAVAEVQDYALSLIRPGVVHREYERQVEACMGKQLQRLGLITSLHKEHIRTYFPHGTSHFLGLDTHDTGDYQAAWEPGMVITCEPGIYIPAEGIGVRIEDDVLITPTGNTVLSAACPRMLTPVQ